MASADKFLKQIWYRSGPKLFDTLMVLPKESYEKVDLEKKSPGDKRHAKLPSRLRVNAEKWPI